MSEIRIYCFGFFTSWFVCGAINFTGALGPADHAGVISACLAWGALSVMIFGKRKLTP